MREMMFPIRFCAMSSVVFQLAMVGLTFLGSAPARAEMVYAREFKGAVELGADRILAWEHVADGSGEMPLWILAESGVPRQIGKLAAETIAATTGADAVVLVADGKLFVTSAKEPGQPTPLEVPGEWLSVVHGPQGFIAGGWANAIATSADGRTWTRMDFEASGEGGIAQLAAGGSMVAALRQTSVMQEGWGVNVSEVCLLEDGKPWRRIAQFEGGSHESPLTSLRWFGDRWVAIGAGVFAFVMPDGRSERIEVELDQAEFGPIGGETPLFREGNGWLMIHEGWLLESADLAKWAKRSRLSADDWQGAWIADSRGAPLLVGATKRDWTKKQAFTLAALLNPPTEAKLKALPAPVNVARAPDAAPVKQASQELTILLFESYASLREEKHEEGLRLAEQALALAKKENHETGIKSAEELRNLAANALLIAGVEAYGAKNYTAARGLWERAAGSGVAQAMFNLGVLYSKGEGVAADPAQAFAWRKKSAEAGYAQGMIVTGSSYEAGHGVEKNLEQARYWREKALAEKLPEDLERRVREQLAGLGPRTSKPVPLPLPGPRGTVLHGGKPRGPDTVYDWPAIMTAAAKRAAAEPKRTVDESIAKKRGTRTNAWTKGSPWTAEDMLAAFRKGANAREIVEVMGLDYDGADLDKPGILTVLTSPEWAEALVRSKAPFATPNSLVAIDLWGLASPRSELADALAREAIAHRQKDVPPATKPVDSPELRQRLAAGDAGAAYQLYQLYYGMQDAAVRPPVPGDLPSGDRLLAQATKDYAPAQWLLASQFEHNVDKTKNDPVRAFELYWTSAMAGDAVGAFKLAKVFAAPGNEKAVARNYAEAEYWFIEAAVCAWPGQMDVPHQRPWLELANLYSAQHANDVLSTLMPSYEDATARWLRLMTSRGGVMADYARLAISYLDEESRGNPRPFDFEKRIAGIPPESAMLPAAEWQKLEISAAGKPAELLRVAESYAGGRLVRQNDLKAVEYYIKAAEAGAGLPAYRALVHHYRNGYGVNKDPAQLLAWTTKAADTNDLAALRELGDALHFVNSDGLAQDYPAAIAAYEKAAALGDLRALYNLGLMHRYGRGVPKDDKKWREFIERAAARNYIPAMKEIAYAYIGSDVKSDRKDYAQAAVWYQKAVEAGDKASRFSLAEALVGANDQAGAQRWYREVAADDPKDVQSRYKLAQLARWDGRRDEAAQWYRQIIPLETIYGFMKEAAADFLREYDEEEAAKPGSLPHYRKLAKTGTLDDMYDYAARVAATNRGEAMRWLRNAALEGHALSTATYYTEQSKTDKEGADKWVREMAEKGNSQAILIVGLLTASTDKPAGLALMEKAAAAGNLDAKLRLGMMQYQGNELPQDRAAGIARITEAAEGGYALAQFTLGKALVGGDVGLPAEPTRGVALLKRAMMQNREGSAALQAAVLLGQIYEQGKVPGIAQDLGAAVDAFKRATELDPQNAQLRNHYNEVHRRMAQAMKGMK